MTVAQHGKRNRWVIVGLFAAFLAPVLAAIWLNSRWSNWHPSVTRNHGELVIPVVPLPVNLRNAHVPQGQWTLLQLGRACGAQCTEEHRQLLNVRRALGRHGEGLAISMLDSPPAAASSTSALAEFIARRWPSDSALFLIDPLGHVMMRYPRGFDPSGLRKDLDRLMKYSKVE